MVNREKIQPDRDGGLRVDGGVSDDPPRWGLSKEIPEDGDPEEPPS